jgi:hypothetical protein
MKGIIATALLACVACGPAPYIEPSLLPYVQRFINDASQYGKKLSYEDLTVIYDSIDSDTVAYCSGADRVVVSKKYWDTFSDLSKELVMYHELGHCLLDRRHTTLQLPSRKPASIMNPVMFNYTESERPYYKQELFENGTYDD